MGEVLNFNAYRTAQNNGQNAHTECNLTFDEHIKYVDALVLAGIIDETTGKSMKQQITANFSAKTQSNMPFAANNVFQEQSGTHTTLQNGLKPAPLFDFGQSEFLKARNCLLKYLQNLDIELTEADLKEIESVVLELEKAAISASQAKNAENALDALKSTNELAKERLITGSMLYNGQQTPPQKVFTRDEIAKMSTAEFIKNEPAINYQLQNGLL